MSSPKKARSLNMFIAKNHKRSRQFVGLYISIANILALWLSQLAIAGGVVVYGMENIPMNPNPGVSIWGAELVSFMIFALMGITLGFLIEGLTISNCHRLRKNVENYRAIKLAHARVEVATKLVELKKKQQLRSVSLRAWGAMLMVLAGATISTVAGALFWHWILQRVGPGQSLMYSTVFSLVVSITLVSSELSRSLNDMLVSEAVGLNGMITEASTATATEQVMYALHDARQETLNDIETRDEVKEAGKAQVYSILDTSIAGGNGNLASTLLAQDRHKKTLEAAAMKYLEHGGSLEDTGSITSLPSVRKDKAKNLSKIKEYLSSKGVQWVKENRDAVAGELGVHPNTIYSYLEELGA